MIYESCYWKDDLLMQARTLRRMKVRRRWPESSLARLEKMLMIGFYSIRKLVESSKLSNSTFECQLPLTTYPWSGKPVTLLNSHKIDQIYDLESPSADSQDVLFLCHQIVHSYVFIPLFTKEGAIDGILFTSDRHRHKQLFSLTLDRIVELFLVVGNDYPNEVRRVYNPAKRDYDVTSTMHTTGNWAR